MCSAVSNSVAQLLTQQTKIAMSASLDNAHCSAATMKINLKFFLEPDPDACGSVSQDVSCSSPTQDCSTASHSESE